MADDSNGMDTSTGQQNDDDRKLFVGRLTQKANEKEITKYFKQFGEITDIELKRNPSGRSRGENL